MKPFEPFESQLIGAEMKTRCSYSSTALVCFTLFSVLQEHKMNFHSKEHSLQHTPRNGEGKWGK